MTIKIGEKIPDVKLWQMTDGGPKPISASAIFSGKKVVMFALPGAFTPTCSMKHLPGYIESYAAFVAKGVDTVACVSVNDAWAMDAWGKAQHADGKVAMFGDGNADFAKALGLEVDLAVAGMGLRSQRYALYAEDGVVRALEIEPGPGLTVSSAETLLTKI